MEIIEAKCVPERRARRKCWVNTSNGRYNPIRETELHSCLLNVKWDVIWWLWHPVERCYPSVPWAWGVTKGHLFLVVLWLRTYNLNIMRMSFPFGVPHVTGSPGAQELWLSVRGSVWWPFSAMERRRLLLQVTPRPPGHRGTGPALPSQLPPTAVSFSPP